MRATGVAEALRDALHLDCRSIQFALVDRHDLNSSINCAEQQKTVGLRATRSKALESGSKLLGFQCCEARGQAPPRKVAGVPVRKRCLIALVQYAISAMKVNVHGSTMLKNASPVLPSRQAWTRQQPADGKINPVPHSSVFGTYQVEPPWGSGPKVS